MAMEPVIKLIPQEVHKKLYKTEYKSIPNYKILNLQNDLEKFKLDIKDDSVFVDLPVPTLKQPLSIWYENKLRYTYSLYLDLATLICEINHNHVANLPFTHWNTSNTKHGWSKFNVLQGVWEAVETPETEAMVFDFETFKQDGQQHPFMCIGLSVENDIYAWMADLNKPLPRTVVFGRKIRLLVGHNAVQFDRRFVAEFYEYDHPVRIMDTYSFYNILYGMSSSQMKTYEVLKKSEGKKPRWFNVTCKGNLSALAEHVLGVRVDKSLREELLDPKKKGYAWTPIVENIVELFQYCYKDTAVTQLLFVPLYTDILKIDSLSYICGHLERSTLRTGVVPDIRERIKNVRQSNQILLQKINRVVINELENRLKEKDSLTLTCVEGWILKDWYERIYKSAGFKSSTKPSKQVIESIELPHSLVMVGWEYDEFDDSKRSVQKNSTLEKLKQVHAYLQGNKTNIKPKTLGDWKKSLFKKANDKVGETFISLAGKMTPIILKMCWKGNRLYINKNTWAYIEDGVVKNLPHPKGNSNVGSPIQKDFFTSVKPKKNKTTGEIIEPLLTAATGVNLVKLYENLSETQLWEKFDKRFIDVYIVDDIWLPAIVPNGTVTGRIAAPLAVVMSNTKNTRAGSEMKSWFKVSQDDNIYIHYDCEAQESGIAAYIGNQDACYPGLDVFSCIVFAGDSTKGTDIHTFVKNYMSADSGLDIARVLAKNMNFANQFLCGVEKLTMMAYITSEGVIPMEVCRQLAISFQTLTRGSQSFGVYSDGIQTEFFNKVKQLSKRFDQKCLLTGRKISAPLLSQNCDDELTTRVNYNIQGTGQGIMDTILTLTRIFATMFKIPYHVAHFIHDELAMETHFMDRKNFLYISQVAHLMTKSLLCHKIGLETMPQNDMWFKTIELDTHLRKDPNDLTITPSNREIVPPGWSVKAKDCMPEDWLRDLILNKPI
jgi:hypothetical protein